ncbi:MAG: SIS domain-containing protein [Deltaproteobacteria bacterium]|nr:SIS domain-containing protein [Deltaproteobacteria bacterium]
MTLGVFPRDALGATNDELAAVEDVERASAGPSRPPNSVEYAFLGADGPSAFARGYLDHLGNVLGRIDVTAIDRVVEALLIARADDRTTFVLGNGGSAATAAHFANDLAMGTQPPSRRFRAFSLVDNAALLSAAANDYGYEEVFVRQLDGVLRPRDVVIAISASGSSHNLLRAVMHANAAGALTIGFTGFDGGRLRQLVHIDVHVPTDNGEYGPSEDAHLALAHVIANYLRLSARRLPK